MIRSDGRKRALVVGEVFVDRHLRPPTVRLGGLFHVARAWDALRCTYAAAWIGPAYLEADCSQYLKLLNAQQHRKIGDVTGAPNIMEIQDPTEAGAQGFTDLLAGSRRISTDSDALRALLSEFRPTNILLILTAATEPIAGILAASGAHLCVDADHWDGEQLAWSASTVFVSTSGLPFERRGRDPEALRDFWRNLGATTVILKENRGGSRVYGAGSPTPVHAPCFPTVTCHSVGVGECFDATWVAIDESEPPQLRLRAAAWVASLYASTLEHPTFIDEVRASSQLDATLLQLAGSELPWEQRIGKHIYLAAPDFPTVDTRTLDELEAALRYHNFEPHRPVLENGLADGAMPAAQQRALYAKDLDLLSRCVLMIAVPLYADPGTFAELGWFAHSGKPTILYDRNRAAQNLFASSSATRVCRSLTAVIDAVFEILGHVPT